MFIYLRVINIFLSLWVIPLITDADNVKIKTAVETLPECIIHVNKKMYIS